MDESNIEFEFETDRSIYLDMRDIDLQIKVGLQKGRLIDDFMKKDEHGKSDIRRLFDDFMKKDEHGKSDIRMSFTDDDLHYLTLVNNLLQSLFSN